MNWNTPTSQMMPFVANMCDNISNTNNNDNSSSNNANIAAPVSASPSIGSNFGVVVPGRPVSTVIEQVDNTRWMTTIGLAPENFIVFMTNPASWLPAEFGIGVYLARCDDMLFQYLGNLTHAHPSALFKTPASFFVNDQACQQSSPLGACMMSNNCSNSNSNINNKINNVSNNVSVVVGLSVEGNDVLENLGVTQQQPLQTTEAMTRNGIAERLLEDLNNFLMSYARCVPQQQMLQIPDGEDYIVLPASFVNKWRERVQKKILKDTGFLNLTS